MPTVLYCHGFLSAPQSKKAQQVKHWMLAHKPDWQYLCPPLSAYPREAKQCLTDIVESLRNTHETIYCIGSSLGGFWCAWLCEQFDLKVVLVNPAVAPHTRFTHFIGQPLNSYYGDHTVTLEPSDLADLQSHDCPTPRNTDRYKVLLQTGDQTLDYRQAKARYAGCNMTIEPGGTHSFEQFDQHLPAIFDFFEAPSAQRSITNSIFV